MYLSTLPAPLSVESSTPSKQTLLREEYMTNSVSGNHVARSKSRQSRTPLWALR